MMKKEKIYLGFLALIPLIAFFPQYTSGKIMGWLDFTFYFIPFRVLTADIIQHGIMPFWNPFVYCGNPLIANMQSAVFYPPNIFYHVLPALLAVKIVTYITFTVMALFTFSFMRLYEASEEGSFLGSIIFVFGFYTMIKAVEFAEINVMAWLPAVLYFTKRYSITSKLHDFLMIPFMLCLSLLGGHAQYFIYVWIIFTFFYIFENIYKKKGGRVKGTKDFIIINIFLLALSLIQLLPTAVFVLNSKRIIGGLSYLEVLGGFIGIEHMLAIVFPFIIDLFSQHSKFLNWVGLINTGILPLFLMSLAFFNLRDKKFKVFLSLMFLFFLGAAFLGHMPFYPDLFSNFSFFSTMKYQSKIIIGLFLVMCILIAKGFDLLFEMSVQELKFLKNSSIIFFIAVFVVYLVADIFKNNIFVIYKNFFDTKMSVQNIYDAMHTYDLMMLKYLVYILILAVSVFLIYVISSGRFKGNKTKAAVVVVSLLSLFIFQRWDYFQYFNESSVFSPTKQVEYLKEHINNSNLRVLAPNIINSLEVISKYKSGDETIYESNDSLFPNIPMNYKIKNLDGFDSLEIGDFARFKSAFNGIDKPWDLPAFSLFSTSYISSKSHITGRYIKQASTGATDIYENSNYLPPAFLASAPFEALNPTKDEALFLLQKTTFNPQKTVIFSDDTDMNNVLSKFTSSAKNTGRSSVDFIMNDSNSFTIKTKSTSAGMLIVTDNYFPGWKAFIDGVETKIMKVDVTFKGVFLQSGEHDIKFHYSPDEFIFGALVSIVFLLLVLPIVPIFLRLF